MLHFKLGQARRCSVTRIGDWRGTGDGVNYGCVEAALCSQVRLCEKAGHQVRRFFFSEPLHDLRQFRVGVVKVGREAEVALTGTIRAQ
jgi:hypothetical protein